MEVELLKKYGSVSPGKIENLDGTTETVDFRFSTAIRFYHNMEDADFPLHWHAPGEIISPIEGTYTVTIAGKTVTLQPHDVLIIASGELHSIRAPKTGERYIMNYSVSYFHQIQDMAELFNTFYPFRLVTRQEAAAMVARAAKLCGLDPSMDEAATKDMLAQFGDYRSVASWAKKPMAFCYSVNILDQSDLNIEPTKAILRCEIAQMLYNMLTAAELI